MLKYPDDKLQNIVFKKKFNIVRQKFLHYLSSSTDRIRPKTLIILKNITKIN